MASDQSAEWVIVPREPTDEMQNAGDRAQYDADDEFVSRDVYRAMIAASPPPLKGAGLAEEVEP